MTEWVGKQEEVPKHHERKKEAKEMDRVEVGTGATVD